MTLLYWLAGGVVAIVVLVLVVRYVRRRRADKRFDRRWRRYNPRPCK